MRGIPKAIEFAGLPSLKKQANSIALGITAHAGMREWDLWFGVNSYNER